MGAESSPPLNQRIVGFPSEDSFLLEPFTIGANRILQFDSDLQPLPDHLSLPRVRRQVDLPRDPQDQETCRDGAEGGEREASIH